MDKILFMIILSFIIVTGCSKSEDIKVEPVKEKIVETQEKVEVAEEKRELTTEESEYLEVLSQSYELVSDNMGVLKEEFSKAEEDKSLYQSGEWFGKTKNSLMRITMTMNLFEGMTNDGLVPESFQEIHELSYKAFLDISVGGDTLFIGIEDDFNEVTVNGGMKIIEKGIEGMVEANNELDKKIEEMK